MEREKEEGGEMKGINEVQRLQFELMQASSFNDFNGEQVVKDLIENKDNWIGCIWGRFGYFDLMPLRDISQGIWNTDTLYILTEKKNIRFLKKMAKKWKADEFGWIEEIENKKGSIYKTYGVFGDKQDFFNRFGGGLKNLAVIRMWWD